MHLYFMVRGVYHQIELFERFMQTQMFPFKRKNLKTGKLEVMQMAGGLRKAPWGYEYVFPEEYLAEVLTMLDIKPENNRWNIGGIKSWIIRKALGKGDAGHKITPIPKYTPDPGLYRKEGKDLIVFPRYIEKNGIAIYPIGIKKDSFSIWEGQYEQEMI